MGYGSIKVADRDSAEEGRSQVAAEWSLGVGRWMELALVLAFRSGSSFKGHQDIIKFDPFAWPIVN